MIASRRGSIRIGSAKLVVDGTDETICRKATFSLSPGRAKARVLDRLVTLSREVYNAGLAERRGAWQLEHRRVSLFDQYLGEIRELRTLRPDITRFGNQPIRGALSRLDEAFGAFFQRVRAGETPGYPRFKGRGRFRTIFYDEPENWAVRGMETDSPALYLQGVGELPLSKSAACQVNRFIGRGGDLRTLTITKSGSGAWRACVGFRGVSVIRGPENHQVAALDRGVAVTAALPDGTHLSVPPFLATARDSIALLQRERARYPLRSTEWKQLNKKIAKAYASAQHKSENWARHTAKEIVARYGVLALEDLRLTNMTKSAKGTRERPGKGVAAKRALNRSLQEAALGRLAWWICVKAEEAGRRVYMVDPTNSSRECVACGHTARENRHRSQFCCVRCGHREHADTNAAQVLTARGEAADAAWRGAGCPILVRPAPRHLRRHRGGDRSADSSIEARAGSARYAAVE